MSLKLTALLVNAIAGTVPNTWCNGRAIVLGTALGSLRLTLPTALMPSMSLSHMGCHAPVVDGRHLDRAVVSAFFVRGSDVRVLYIFAKVALFFIIICFYLVWFAQCCICCPE